MKSTTTRLAASVLAIAIPFAPTVAHADTQERARSSYNQLGEQTTYRLPDAVSPTSAVSALALNPTTHSTLVHAIESAASAARLALDYHQTASNSDLSDATRQQEGFEQASTSLEAAFAEAAYARSLLPNDADELASAFDLILADLRQLRDSLDTAQTP